MIDPQSKNTATLRMNLLDYDSVCQFDIPSDGPAGLVIFYQKHKSDYTAFLQPELQFLSPFLVDHLSRTKASKSSCTRLISLTKEIKNKIIESLTESNSSKNNQKESTDNSTEVLKSSNSEIASGSAESNTAKGTDTCRQNTFDVLQNIEWICLSAISKNAPYEVRIAASAASSVLSSNGASTFIITPAMDPKNAAIGICLSLYSYNVLKTQSNITQQSPSAGNQSSHQISEHKASSCLGQVDKNNLDHCSNTHSKNGMTTQCSSKNCLAKHLNKKQKFNVMCTAENDEFNFGMKAAYYQNITRFLSDTPANLMTPTLFCEYAKVIGSKAGLSITCHEKEYIESENMRLFLSVSAGSREKPMYLVCEYIGRSRNDTLLSEKEFDSESDTGLETEQELDSLPDSNRNSEIECFDSGSSQKETGSNSSVNPIFDICLIGKGVTFDSGGISLKGAQGMAEMKGDMQGAAASFSAACLAASQKLKINLSVEIPLTENMPGGSATKPGDVILAKDNQSVEIDNTDAEGRLILADALIHAQKRKNCIFIDTATLTGAMRVALGGVYAGLFTRSNRLADDILAAGVSVEDRVWRMPLGIRFDKNIDSDVADVRNTGDRGSAGSTAGAGFLQRFVKTKKWAHIDIASTMTNAEPKSIFKKGMSGRGTLLLYAICERYASKIATRMD